MIVANGYIQAIAESGGGVDPATGYPRSASVILGDMVPCQWRPCDIDMQTKLSGEALVDGVFRAKRFRLYYADGSEAGEYSAASVERLDQLDMTRVNF